MKEKAKERIRAVLAQKKKTGDALFREMEASSSENATITIESLYTQLQSLKHEIDIEVILKKLKTYDRLFSFLIDHEGTLLEMISWYNERKNKENING